MVAGIIVSFALFAILEVAVKQNARIDDRVQSQQLGDTAMTKVIDPLRSGCLSREATPVQPGSTPTKLIFTTAFSEATAPAASEVYKETVELLPTHVLQAKVQKATAGAWPTYSGWEVPAKTVRLGENIYPATSGKEVFTYYKYAPVSVSSAETGSSSMVSVTTGAELKEAEAKTIAGVEVAFLALPQSNNSAQHRGTEFNDRVTFAFSTPASEASIIDGPCQ